MNDYEYPEKPKRGMRSSRRRAMRGDKLVPGLIMVGLGLIFMLQAFDVFSMDWGKVWPLFILIPGFVLIFSAWREYAQDGDFDRGQAFSGVMAILVGLIFFFDWDWGKVWPLFLIVPGLGMLLGWIGDDDDEDKGSHH
ncbi:MAG: hypothetical protein H6673_05410 [Anaerolineales bacterium]|nr:hypothetical protein [Anaerolineales bacterium]